MFAQAETRRKLHGMHLNYSGEFALGPTCITWYKMSRPPLPANLCYRGHALQCAILQVLEPDEADIKKVIRQ